ncbi:hypothetical protein BU15DRAFT_64603 [Melanogaster broomeanus]|nr:hypothetical protein BU15DRAFT_64603 [Melanogaster broomeanus]
MYATCAIQPHLLNCLQPEQGDSHGLASKIVAFSLEALEGPPTVTLQWVRSAAKPHRSAGPRATLQSCYGATVTNQASKGADHDMQAAGYSPTLGHAPQLRPFDVANAQTASSRQSQTSLTTAWMHGDHDKGKPYRTIHNRTLLKFSLLDIVLASGSSAPAKSSIELDSMSAPALNRRVLTVAANERSWSKPQVNRGPRHEPWSLRHSVFGLVTHN